MVFMYIGLKPNERYRHFAITNGGFVPGFLASCKLIVTMQTFINAVLQKTSSRCNSILKNISISNNNFNGQATLLINKSNDIYSNDNNNSMSISVSKTTIIT